MAASEITEGRFRSPKTAKVLKMERAKTSHVMLEEKTLQGCAFLNSVVFM